MTSPPHSMFTGARPLCCSIRSQVYPFFIRHLRINGLLSHLWLVAIRVRLHRLWSLSPRKQLKYITGDI